MTVTWAMSLPRRQPSPAGRRGQHSPPIALFRPCRQQGGVARGSWHHRRLQPAEADRRGRILSSRRRAAGSAMRRAGPRCRPTAAEPQNSRESPSVIAATRSPVTPAARSHSCLQHRAPRHRDRRPAAAARNLPLPSLSAGMIEISLSLGHSSNMPPPPTGSPRFSSRALLSASHQGWVSKPVHIGRRREQVGELRFPLPPSGPTTAPWCLNCHVRRR